MANWIKARKVIVKIRLMATVPLDTLDTKEQHRKFRREHKN